MIGPADRKTKPRKKVLNLTEGEKNSDHERPRVTMGFKARVVLRFAINRVKARLILKLNN